MVKYNESIIYKLCCNDLNITDIYIGSTTNFNRRRAQHKLCCNNEKTKQFNCRVYKFIRDHGNWGNWSMLQIEQYEAKDKRDLEMRERYWIETLNSSLNKNIPTQTSSEYYQNNKEKIAEHRAEYYQNNKEVILEKLAENYQNNKEVIAEYNAEKVVCECGSEVNKSSLLQHKKTKKHINFLKL
jgi:predicted GIY-YIG superfamily endonuclease